MNPGPLFLQADECAFIRLPTGRNPGDPEALNPRNRSRIRFKRVYRLYGYPSTESR